MPVQVVQFLEKKQGIEIVATAESVFKDYENDLKNCRFHDCQKSAKVLYGINQHKY